MSAEPCCIAAVQAGVQAVLQERMQDTLAAEPLSDASVAWLQSLAGLAAAVQPASRPSASLLEAWDQHKAPLLSNMLRQGLHADCSVLHICEQHDPERSEMPLSL